MARPRDASLTVWVALVSNLGVAAAKLIASVITASPAMSAEASHALADTGNQVLLLVARHRSVRPRDERHPFGYGREAYFWALLAAVVVFLAGAVFSLREGIIELAHPAGASTFTVAYVVLAVSVVLDGGSLVQSVGQLRRESRLFARDFLDQVMLTSDPTVRAVFAEDAAAIVGDGVAFAGLVLHQATGASAFEGVAALLIGALLVVVGAQLAKRNRDFLLGEQAPAPARERIRGYLLEYPAVVAVRELLVTFVGPRRVWVLARLDIVDTLRGDEVERLVRTIEADVLQRSDYVDRVDVVPVGAAVPAAGKAAGAHVASGPSGGDVVP